MSFLDIAKDLWTKVLDTEQAVPIITAVVTGIHDTASGVEPNVLASIGKRYPELIDALEALAQSAGIFVGGPLGGLAAKELVAILSMSHAMTVTEQQAWFDRQASTN